MTSAYSAMRSVPDSHLINDYQPLDHRLISFTISTYSADWSEPVRQLISTSQPLDHFTALLVIQLLVIHLISACQPLENYLAATGPAPN